VLSVAALCFALSLPALAQTTGRIRGNVTDPDGEPIPGVTVSVSGENLPGGARTAISGENGSFRISALPPGNYNLVAEMDGFQTETIENIRVGINATANANFYMYAELMETVTVTSEAPLVDVTSSAVGNSFTAEFIKDLPTNRNFYDMISVSPGVSISSEGSDRQIAFGANMQSNAWHIDGLEASAPETGTSWISTNPDMIEEIQVLGIGAPAEFGNMLGAAFNVVTKSGGNELKGALNAYYQSDNLTNSPTLRPDTEWPDWTRNEFWDVTATLGGPIKQDSIWFFAAFEYWRDGLAAPGNDPAFVEPWYSDVYDLKLTVRLNDKNYLDMRVQYNEWGYPASYPYATPSATGGELGDNQMWAINWQSIFTDRTFMELRYSGWTTNDDYLSSTGSTEPAFIDYSPPGGGVAQYSGGLWYPWVYDTGIQQVDATVSHFVDEFLAGDHDFKFGVRYGAGEAKTKGNLNGKYYYRYVYEYDYYGTIYPYEYFYKVEYQPYYYGNDQTALSLFVDDAWRVNERLTLNLGLRYDRAVGSIPDYPQLDIDGNKTGETIPGVDPVFTWNNVSPRLGFAYSAGAQQKTVIRGSFGVYYDGNVGGDWNAPPPGPPLWTGFWGYTPTGPWNFNWNYQAGAVSVDPDLEAPRTLQYALGFETEFAQKYSYGVMLVYKDTKNLIGFQNLGDGVYDEVPFTDPFTGNQYTLLDQVVQPTIIRGNNPGFTANPQVKDYYQDYHGVLLTFNRRFTDWWGLQANYTYSKSNGLIPRMLSQTQFNPPYGFIFDGRDPNNFINAEDQRLQGDRPHMFRVQANFELPWNMHANTNINLQSGRPYSRQIDVFGLGQGRSTVIMEPASDSQRHDFQSIVDFSFGKRFNLPKDGVFKAQIQVFNLFNNDASDEFETLRLQEGDVFIPDYWVLPRRIMLRLGVEY
ncbi:MAG: TonB-dependent receptor, partial [Thermoanaerobaculia bacterium]